MIVAKPLTDEQIREVVPKLGGTKRAQASLLKQAIEDRDHSARFALAFWARRLGVTS